MCPTFSIVPSAITTQACADSLAEGSAPSKLGSPPDVIVVGRAPASKGCQLRGTRKGGACGVIAIGLVAAFASHAPASQATTPARPNPQALWQAYPLTPTRTQPAPLRPGAPANRPHQQPPARPRAGLKDQRSGPTLALIAAVAGGSLLVFILPATLLLRARRRTAALAEPAASSHAGTSASSPSVERAALAASARSGSRSRRWAETQSPHSRPPPEPASVSLAAPPSSAPAPRSPPTTPGAPTAPPLPFGLIVEALNDSAPDPAPRSPVEPLPATATDPPGTAWVPRSPPTTPGPPTAPPPTAPDAAPRSPVEPLPFAATAPADSAPALGPTAPSPGPPTALPPIVPEQGAHAPVEPFPATALSLICEIKWVRGRGDGEFQAILPAPDGGQLVLAHSPRFPWRLPLVSPDATPRAAAAHETLVRQLLAAGWQPCGAGLLNWYAHRFRAPETFSAEAFTALSRTETDA